MASRRGAEALDDHLQHPVADRVAVQVVDALELVEVEQKEHVLVPVRLRPARRLRERVEHGAPVRQAGQRIARGLMAQLVHLQVEHDPVRDIAALLVQPAHDEGYDAGH